MLGGLSPLRRTARNTMGNDHSDISRHQKLHDKNLLLFRNWQNEEALRGGCFLLKSQVRVGAACPFLAFQTFVSHKKASGAKSSLRGQFNGQWSCKSGDVGQMTHDLRGAAILRLPCYSLVPRLIRALGLPAAAPILREGSVVRSSSDHFA